MRCPRLGLLRRVESKCVPTPPHRDLPLGFLGGNPAVLVASDELLSLVWLARAAGQPHQRPWLVIGVYLTVEGRKRNPTEGNQWG